MNTLSPNDGGASGKPAKVAGVVNLSDARRRVRERVEAAHASLSAEIEATRELLDGGQATKAEARLHRIIKDARDDEDLLAQARCMLSISLETQGHHADSLAAVQMYEDAQARANLNTEISILLRVQLGLAYTYTGDHPRAIALLNGTLREASDNDGAQLGAIYIALARVYRHINEYKIARDNSQLALSHYRKTGDWRGMAESYRGLALESVFEGAYEQSLEYYEQALKLVGDHPAPFMLGKIYATMAGACWFLKRPQDGIRYLEKAIDYYERTDQKINAIDGYNNLGINLILVGDWARAQQMLERALELASEVDEQAVKAKVAMILDSLGELQMLRGNLLKAQDHLQRAVRLSHDHGNKWYACQALRTLARCHLSM
ncbi:MAG TPA: tetratricopeptide repeat protein, partial [Pyrinomonadaceae bacterium]